MSENSGVLGSSPNDENNNGEVFWNGAGQIIPSLLYKFFERRRFGLYYPKNSDVKNTNPVVVKETGNVVSEVGDTYLLQVAKIYILEKTEEEGKSDAIIDSLHSKIGLFGSKNQKLLAKLDLDFVEDTKEIAYLFFKNGVVEITEKEIQLKQYADFDGYVWEKNIIDHDFSPASFEELVKKCDFMHFLHDITKVDDEEESGNRFASIFSIVGYLSHRYKDNTNTKAIILMDVAPSGNPNGRTGKTLICQAVGKVRSLSIIDGKGYDQRRWFRFSSVGISTDLLLFDDIQKNFDFEQLFPLMTTGLQIQRKYKDDVFIPFEDSPKIVITTNYAVIGEGSSFKGRTFEFEVSNTFNADYQPTDKYGKRFFDDWDEKEWNLFYNLIAHAIKFYLWKGLVESKPINLKLSKLIHQTNEDFVDFCKVKIQVNVKYDKRDLFDSFKREFPEYGTVTQRTFTEWLRRWGTFIGKKPVETHSGTTRYILFPGNPKT
ncbi:MAG: hypothetical protein HQ521_07790 [Bacteroidetes bacterium]|nr:hypothetical protein [Bacteroidota bacterium]